MVKDQTLEPSTIYRADLIDITEILEDDLRYGVIAAYIDTTKKESHYRFTDTIFFFILYN